MQNNYGMGPSDLQNNSTCKNCPNQFLLILLYIKLNKLLSLCILFSRGAFYLLERLKLGIIYFSSFVNGMGHM